MTVQILQETTKWPDGTPNHTYAYNPNTSKMVAFRHSETNEVKVMSRPIMFDKKGRTFTQVHDAELYLIAISS